MNASTSTAWFCVGGAHVVVNSPGHAEPPTVPTQLEYAWTAVHDLELQRAADNEVLEQVCAGRPIVQVLFVLS